MDTEPKPASRRPGGKLQGKPIQGIDGQWYDKFGNKIPPQTERGPKNKDEEYSQRFWDRDQPDGLREVMIYNLESAVKRGTFSLFVDPKGITEKDKEKLSAYRLLAKETGFEIGEFVFSKETYTVTATISQIEK